MRSVPVSRAARAALAVPALLLVLAACGGDQTTSVAARTTETAGSSAGASSSAAGSWDEKTLLPAVKAAVEDQKTVHLSMDSSWDGSPMNAEGDLAWHGGRPEMALTMDGSMFGSGSVEVRVVGRSVYFSAPPMTPKGKFVEIRPGDASSPFGGMRGQMHGMDPRETFKSWQSGIRKVTYLGTENVHGVDLEHYRLTVDLHSAPKAMPQMMSGMPRTVRYEVWVDGEALPHRVELKPMRHGSVVMELSRWGDPVSIERPPADQVVEFPAR